VHTFEMPKDLSLDLLVDTPVLSFITIAKLYEQLAWYKLGTSGK